MSNIIEGTYTIAEVLKFTKQHFNTRFFNAKRDKIYGNIRIAKIITLKSDRSGEPTIRYNITSTSTPRYYPYLKTPKTGRYKNRNIVTRTKHKYDVVIEMDRLSLNTKAWKARLGSDKKYREAPQSAIRQIRKKTRENWSKERIKKQREDRSKYVSAGDWVARKLGINMDFYVRCMEVYKKNGHLFGRYYGDVTSENKIMFFPKHLIVVIQLLMEKGVLKDN